MKKFFKDESGQGMVEYGLIIALVAVAIIAAVVLLKDKIAAVFNRAGNALDNAGT